MNRHNTQHLVLNCMPCMHVPATGVYWWSKVFSNQCHLPVPQEQHQDCDVMQVRGTTAATGRYFGMSAPHTCTYYIIIMHTSFKHTSFNDRLVGEQWTRVFAIVTFLLHLLCGDNWCKLSQVIFPMTQPSSISSRTQHLGLVAQVVCVYTWPADQAAQCVRMTQCCL